MKDPEVEADEILNLKDMFPGTPIMMIQSIYERNNCCVCHSIVELSRKSTSEDIQSDSDSNETTGPGTSGASQKNHQQDNVLVISDEEDADDDMPVEDLGFSQKISVNKLTYLQGIFPDVQLGCLTKNLAQIGDDDTNFKIFLNKCLADPTRLPRQARVVPSVKRVHPGADAALEKNPVKAHNIKESSSSSKKRKKRSVGNSGKGMVKIAYDDEFECSLCRCDLLEVTWVKCKAGCKDLLLTCTRFAHGYGIY